jgi:hypothetical protein
MPSQEKINLRKVLAALYIVYTQRKAKIEPAQIQRMGFYEVECPFWDSIFVPEPKERNQE